MEEERECHQETGDSYSGDKYDAANTAHWESMRTFPMCTVGLARCRSRLAWCPLGCIRLCTKFQLNRPTGTVRTSYGPSCLVLGQLELLQQKCRQFEISVFYYFRIIISYDNVILTLTLQTLLPFSAQLRFVRLT